MRTTHMLSESIRTSHATLAGLTASPRPLLVSRVGRAVDLVLIWHERARQRRQLRSLSTHMLRDIGLSRADVEGEASKPFWRS
jgi:uncharacterized protein YjiS (DUF1127 family)